MRVARGNRALEYSENGAMQLTPEDEFPERCDSQRTADAPSRAQGRRGWLAMVCMLALAGCATGPNNRALPPTVIAALQKAEMTDAVLGVVAYPLTDPARGLRLNPDLPQRLSSPSL